MTLTRSCPHAHVQSVRCSSKSSLAPARMDDDCMSSRQLKIPKMVNISVVDGRYVRGGRANCGFAADELLMSRFLRSPPHQGGASCRATYPHSALVARERVEQE